MKSKYFENTRTNPAQACLVIATLFSHVLRLSKQRLEMLLCTLDRVGNLLANLIVTHA